jgi:uncharacterized protein with ParB-like and HNH nuclease domain
VFQEFYNNYLSQVYLKSIKFYKHFESPKEYERNFKKALKGTGASGVGKMTALSWIAKLPGEDQIGN